MRSSFNNLSKQYGLNNPKKEQGVTLIELIIAIGLALALSVSGLLFYSQLQFKTKILRAEERLQARARVLTSHFDYVTRNAGYTGCLTGEEYNKIITQAVNTSNDHSTQQQDLYYFAGPIYANLASTYPPEENEVFSVTSMMKSRPTSYRTIQPTGAISGGFSHILYAPYFNINSSDNSYHQLLTRDENKHNIGNIDRRVPISDQSKLYQEGHCEPQRNDELYSTAHGDTRYLGSKNEWDIALRYRQTLETVGFKYGEKIHPDNNEELFATNRYVVSPRFDTQESTRIETQLSSFKIQIGIANKETPDSPYVHEYIDPERLRVIKHRPYQNGEAPDIIENHIPTYLIRSIKYSFILEDPYDLVDPITVSRTVRIYNPRLISKEKLEKFGAL